MNKKIMIVDDDQHIQEELDYMLKKSGYETCTTNDFSNTANIILKYHPDLLLLDLNLPHATGFEICKEVREKSNIPILILTSSEEIKDELQALKLGADDYLTKPFHKDRLLARIKNIISRNSINNNCVIYKQIKLDLSTYTLYYGNMHVLLTENQCKIMEMLLTNVGSVVNKKDLFKGIWGTDEYIDENTLQVNMTRLKRSISVLNLDYHIVAIRGKGYKFDDERKQEDAQ